MEIKKYIVKNKIIVLKFCAVELLLSKSNNLKHMYRRIIPNYLK